MIGMIKKDLYMIKNNYKSILIALAIYIFYAIEFDMDMSFFLPFMGLMTCISTLNYDDFYNFHAYATSFPQGKTGAVKSKYITTIIVTVLLTLISILLNLVLSNINLNLTNSPDTILGILCAMLFMMSILYPILFKYGAEKGRIAMVAIAFAIFAVVILFRKVINIKISNSLISFLDKYYLPIFAIGIIIIITISYLISKKIYLKREF